MPPFLPPLRRVATGAELLQRVAEIQTAPWNAEHTVSWPSATIYSTFHSIPGETRVVVYSDAVSLVNLILPTGFAAIDESTSYGTRAKVASDIFALPMGATVN